MFTVPNVSTAAFADQARLFSQDLEILAAALGGTGVVSGCAVTAQGTPDMTVAVAAGTVKVDGGSDVSVAAGNVTVTNAHATLDRIDLIVASSAGVKSCTAGTAAADPEPPAIPATSVVLAMVFVPAADTDIDSNQIVDKRTEPAASGASAAELLASQSYRAGSDTSFSTTSTSAVDIDATNLAVTFTAPASGVVLVRFSGRAYLTGAADGFWIVREGTTNVASSHVTNINGGLVGVSTTFKITGLSAGSHTYKWGWKVTANTLHMHNGPGSGECVMEVWAA